MKYIFWCKNCLNTSTRPRISFDKRGWCNACQWSEEKKILNWKKREKELLKLLDKHRSKNNAFDCVVPVSGGKDGSYIAYTLKNRYGMNPLTISVTPPLALHIGENNLTNFIVSGFHLIQLRLNQQIMQFLDKRGFIDKGLPYLGWMIAVHTAVIRTALNYDLSIVFYGEDGEVEYGGSTETIDTSLISVDYQKRIWFENGYEKVLKQLPKNLKPNSFFWTYPSTKELGSKKIYTTTWSYFENWDSYRNYLVAKKFCKLNEKEDGTKGTFTNFSQNDQALYSLHTYLMYLKFGFGRATQDAGIEIRRGAMTRNQAKNLANLYDNHYPLEFLDLYLDYYKMKKDEFNKVIDHWTNKRLFKKVSGLWTPKFKII